MRSDIAGPINLAELTIVELAEAIRTLTESFPDIQSIPLPVDTIGWRRTQWQNQLPDLDPATGFIDGLLDVLLRGSSADDLLSGGQA